MKPTLPSALRVLIGAIVVWLASDVAPPVAGPIWSGIQQARTAAEQAPLEHSATVEALAERWAREVAALPERRRLRHDLRLRSALREAGLDDVLQVQSRVELLRGQSNPERSALGAWRADATWNEVLMPSWTHGGVGSARATDGWSVFVTVLVERGERSASTTLAEPERWSTRRLEREVLAGVNRIRRDQGLSMLRRRDALAAVAREHSADMARRDYFSHWSPDGSGPLQRLREGGVDPGKVAENLHKSRGTQDPVRAALDGWWNSPPHRAAMLADDVEQTGVGVVQAEDGTLYFTQLFVSPRPGGRP